MPSPTARWAVAICALAFVLRCIYIFALQHLLIQFGDAYCFLAGASKLREFVCAAWQAGHFNLLSELPPASPNGIVAMRSIAVADRLMVDGPTFPIYLAIMQWIVGLTPGSLLFDSKALAMSVFNAFFDSLTCLFVFLGTRNTFGLKVAAVAGGLCAIYPASIINTQSCYAEPFGCFVLSVWSWLALSAFSRGAASLFTRAPMMILLGIVTGALTLTRPPFVSLPFVFGLLLIALRLWQKQKETRLTLSYLQPLLPLSIGLALVFVPWMAFTHQATGKFTVMVNRVPAFNLYLGNQLDRDGWRAYPFPADIPETVPAAARQIMAQAQAEPLRFISMELRKIPRLWCGVWNEFQYSLFGIPIKAQEIFHQLLLGLAAIGLLLLITKRETLKEMDTAVCYAVAILVVQSLYLAFEPISRYTMTAMPAIFMLAAYSMVQLASKPKTLLPCLLLLTGLIAAMQLDSEVIALFASLLGRGAVLYGAAAVNLLLLGAVFVGINSILRKSAIGSTAFSWALGCAFFAVGVLKVICIFGNPELSEWKTVLTSTEQSLQQEITLPRQVSTDARYKNQTAYILLDISQGQSPAPLAVALNGVKFEAIPIPWLQLQPDKDFIDVLSLQAKGMGVSLYSYRQWWVLPVPSSLLKYGAANTVVISPATKTPLTVYGDYSSDFGSNTGSDNGSDTAQNPNLPSLKLVSWTKNFCTYDHQDARIYESMDTAKVRSSCRSGQYRVRLLTIASAGSGAAADTVPVTAVSQPQEREISGGDIVAMQVASATVKASSRPIEFQFSCELASPKSSGTAFVGVGFEGKDAQGTVKKWSSPWQPSEIKTEKTWTPVYFSDSIPAEYSGLHDLKTVITVCPFHPDLLSLQQKQAIRRKVLVRNLSLKCASP